MASAAYSMLPTNDHALADDGFPVQLGTFAQRPEVLGEYAAEMQALLVSRLRLTCWLAMILVPLFGVLDAVMYPGLLGSFLMIRVVMVLPAAAALMALRSAAAARFA